MDYIVFGTGYGATLLVLGWVLRTFGPGFRYRAADADTPARADEMVHRMSWTRFAEALGAVVATAGAAVILVTFLTALINPGDHAGAIVLWIAFAAVIIGVAVWTWFYVARFGAEGLVPAQLDVGRLLERGERRFSQHTAPRERTVPAGPEPAAAVSIAPPLVAATAEELDPVEEDVVVPEHDDEDDELVYDDDDYEDDAAEMAVRSSRYQAHHPDEGDAYQGLFSMYGVEERGADTDDSPIQGPALAEEAEVEESGDSLEEDGEPIEEDVPGNGHQPGATGEEIEAEDDPEFDDNAPLPDTPEGRAEALRRLQMWEPDPDS